jgi:hypothetical protein
MSERRYVVLTLDDAKALAAASTGVINVRQIRERLMQETGADMDDIVQQFKELEICAACSVEGQERSCVVHVARQQGRRLKRLLERARGERAPGPVKR